MASKRPKIIIVKKKPSTSKKPLINKVTENNSFVGKILNKKEVKNKPQIVRQSVSPHPATTPYVVAPVNSPSSPSSKVKEVIRKIIIYFFPLILLLCCGYAIIYKFFPALAEGIGKVAGTVYEKVKNVCYTIHDKTSSFLEKELGCSKNVSKVGGFVLPIVGLIVLAAIAFFIPAIGPFLTAGILAFAVGYTLMNLTRPDRLCPSNLTPPQPMQVLDTNPHKKPTDKTQVENESSKKRHNQD